MTDLRLRQLCEHGFFFSMLVPLRNFQLSKFKTLPQAPKDEIIYFSPYAELQTWSVQPEAAPAASAASSTASCPMEVECEEREKLQD